MFFQNKLNEVLHYKCNNCPCHILSAHGSLSILQTDCFTWVNISVITLVFQKGSSAQIKAVCFITVFFLYQGIKIINMWLWHDSSETHWLPTFFCRSVIVHSQIMYSLCTQSSHCCSLGEQFLFFGTLHLKLQMKQGLHAFCFSLATTVFCLATTSQLC